MLMYNAIDKLALKHNVDIYEVLDKLRSKGSKAAYIYVHPHDNHNNGVRRPTRYYLSATAIRDLQTQYVDFINGKLTIAILHQIETEVDSLQPLDVAYSPIDKYDEWLNNEDKKGIEYFCIYSHEKISHHNNIPKWVGYNSQIFTSSIPHISPANVYISSEDKVFQPKDDAVKKEVTAAILSQPSNTYPPYALALLELCDYFADNKISIQDKKNSEIMDILFQLHPELKKAGKGNSALRIVQMAVSGHERRGNVKKNKKKQKTLK